MVLITIIACFFSFLFGWVFCKHYYKVRFLIKTLDLFVDICAGKLSEEELRKRVVLWQEECKKEVK